MPLSGRHDRLQCGMPSILELPTTPPNLACAPSPPGGRPLLVGSEAGDKAAAIACTLTETVRLDALEPQARLAVTFAGTPDDRITKMDDLQPWRRNGWRSDRALAYFRQPNRAR